MTEADAQRIGRAWAEAAGPLLPGMVDLYGDRILSVLPSGRLVTSRITREGHDHEDEAPEFWYPDPRDDATLGCMRGAVRRAWRDPDAYANRAGGSAEIGVWHVHISAKDPVSGQCYPVSRRGPTEPEVWIAAWKARPTYP